MYTAGCIVSSAFTFPISGDRWHYEHAERFLPTAMPDFKIWDPG